MTTTTTPRPTIITIGEDGTVSSSGLDRRTRWTATALAVVLGMGALAMTAVATVAVAIIGVVAMTLGLLTRGAAKVANVGRR